MENSSRQLATQSLLELSNVGNGTTYCESHSGTHTMTDLTMSDIAELTDQHCELMTLCEENANLKKEQSRSCKTMRKL